MKIYILVVFFINFFYYDINAQNILIRKYEYLMNNGDTINANLYMNGLVKLERISIDHLDSPPWDTINFTISKGSNFISYILQSYESYLHDNENYFEYKYTTVIPFSTTAQSLQYNAHGIGAFNIPQDGQIYYIKSSQERIFEDDVIIHEFLIVADYDLVRTETRIFLESKYKLPIRGSYVKYRKISYGEQLIRVQEENFVLKNIIKFKG